MTQRPSAYVLILANLIPVAGVLLFDWNVLSILILYWAESVVIGIINYIGNDEYKRASLFVLMFRPYGRIMTMQIAILFGAAFVMFFGSPLPMLLILIAAKIVIDLRLHGKERDKFSVAQLLTVEAH